MKKRIALVLCIVMLLSMMLTGCSKSVDVVTDLTDLELNGETKVKTGEDYSATLEVEDDFVLPEEITVKIDGSKVSDKKYEYNPETGDLFIPGDLITGEIEIIAEAEELTLVGQWLGTVDLSDVLNTAIVSSDPSLGQYFSFSGLTLDIHMVLTEDGTCTLSVDSASAQELMDGLKSQMADGFTAYVEDLMAEYGYDYTAEEFLGLMGYTMDSFIEEYIDTDSLVGSLTDISSTGKYVAEDGMLYMADSMDKDPKSVAGNPYVLDGNKLTIEASSNSDADSFMYPLVMERVG